MEDEFEGESPSLPDFSGPAAPPSRDVLPLAFSPNPEQEAFRKDHLCVARSAFSTSAASGAVRIYEAVIRGIAPKVMRKLGSHVVPKRSSTPSGLSSCLAPNPRHL